MLHNKKYYLVNDNLRVFRCVGKYKDYIFGDSFIYVNHYHAINLSPGDYLITEGEKTYSLVFPSQAYHLIHVVPNTVSNTVDLTQKAIISYENNGRLTATVPSYIPNFIDPTEFSNQEIPRPKSVIINIDMSAEIRYILDCIKSNSHLNNPDISWSINASDHSNFDDATVFYVVGGEAIFGVNYNVIDQTASIDVIQEDKVPEDLISFSGTTVDEVMDKIRSIKLKL